jgi:hypothetical protein
MIHRRRIVAGATNGSSVLVADRPRELRWLGRLLLPAAYAMASIAL